MSGCKSPTPSSQPRWIGEPKSDDSIYLYRVGHAAGLPNADAARDAAFQDALSQIVRIFIPQLKGGAAPPPAGAFAFGKVELVPGCVYTEKHASGHESWVQISWPLSEKRLVEEKIERGRKLNGLWVEAQSALNRGQPEKTQELLNEIFKAREESLFVGFDKDEAKLLMGDSYRVLCDTSRKWRYYLVARRWYADVQNTSNSDRWKQMAVEKLRLPSPVPQPIAGELYERWNGRTVALLCVIREGKVCRRFMDLTNVLTKYLGDAELTSVDIAGQAGASEMAAFFDSMDLAAIRSLASARNAGIVLGVLFDIDSQKRGTTTQAYGVTLPAMDSMVRFIVVRVEDGKIVYNGQFKETAGAMAESRLADRAAAIMIAKYLVPQCPAMLPAATVGQQAPEAAASPPSGK